jgi:uncharacterized membrane protein YhaH (DUF805 family)
MDLVNLFFSFQGRINRAKYWLVTLIWLAVWIVVWLAVIAAVFTSGSWGLAGVIGLLVLIPSIVSGVSVGIRRLHDRDKSGWWLLVFYLAPGILQSVGSQMGAVGPILSLAGFGVSVWAFVELGCLRGTVGPNTYGPDPLQADAAQPA